MYKFPFDKAPACLNPALIESMFFNLNLGLEIFYFPFKSLWPQDKRSLLCDNNKLNPSPQEILIIGSFKFIFSYFCTLSKWDSPS